VQAITSARHRRGVTIITAQQAMTATENRNEKKSSSDQTVKAVAAAWANSAVKGDIAAAEASSTKRGKLKSNNQPAVTATTSVCHSRSSITIVTVQQVMTATENRSG